MFLGRSNNRTPRNIYTVNLAVSGIIVGVFCMPTTLAQVLYGGWWHFGLFACKAVPAIQGIKYKLDTIDFKSTSVANH